jgi:hypothetical protein
MKSEIYRVSWNLTIKIGSVRQERFFTSKAAADQFLIKHQEARQILGLLNKDSEAMSVKVHFEAESD